MTLLETVRLAIAADDAYDPNNGGPAYELIAEAAKECRTVLARRPNATGPLVDAARLYVTWDDADTDIANVGLEDTDWNRYDVAIEACRLACI